MRTLVLYNAKPLRIDPCGTVRVSRWNCFDLYLALPRGTLYRSAVLSRTADAFTQHHVDSIVGILYYTANQTQDFQSTVPEQIIAVGATPWVSEHTHASCDPL